MATTYRHDSSYAQRRMVVFVWIVGIHLALIWAFASGLANRVVQLVTPPIETKILEETKKDDLPPPPPPPELERPPVQVVAPEITINLTPDAPPPPIAVVTTQPVITQPPRPAPVVPSTTLGRVSGPNAEEYYPNSSRIAGNEGVAKIKVCVTAAGKLASADVGESSGFPALDEAGVKVAKASRFKAATREGKPIDTCATLPIRFSLKKS